MNTSIPIPLSPAQIEKAIAVGKARDTQTLAAGGRHNFEPPKGWTFATGQIMAVKSEMAVAIALDLRWGQSVGDIHAIDVGGKVEVRAVASPGGDLRIRPKDLARWSCPSVLAHVLPEEEAHLVLLLGWAFPREAATVPFWREKPTGRLKPDGKPETFGAWYLPQSALHDMAELVAMREAWSVPRLRPTATERGTA